MVGQRVTPVHRASLETLVDVDRLAAIAEQRIADGADENRVARHFVDG